MSRASSSSGGRPAAATRVALIALAALAALVAAPRPAAAAPAPIDACDAASDPASCAAASAAAAAVAAASGSGALPAPDSIDYFPGVPKRIEYKGADSPDPFSYRYYNADERICAPAPAASSAKGSGKPVCQTMKEWLRMSVAFWHSMRADGSDPFGHATKRWPWGAAAAAGGGAGGAGGAGGKAPDARLDAMQLAFRAMHANFQLLRILGLELWSFHDRDIAPMGADLAESNDRLRQVAEVALELQKGTNVSVLWGTAQLFAERRYMHGAATAPNVSVYAHAAGQVKSAIDATVLLGGENYLLWGGREGYSTLLNTDYAHEQATLAAFLRMIADYAKKAGLKGHLFLEPKPHEPSKHQYDYDVATTLAFLRKHGLEGTYTLNIECNHATLSGHSCEHEVVTASADGAWASFDANSGDPQLGWDTDEFLTDPHETTRVMLALLRQGGWPRAKGRGGSGRGGINFDAKLRRESVDPSDLVLAHVSGIDALARGLRSAARLLEEGRLDALVADRYASWREKGGIAERVLAGKATLPELEAWALKNQELAEDVRSGRQEMAELLVARAIV